MGIRYRFFFSSSFRKSTLHFLHLHDGYILRRMLQLAFVEFLVVRRYSNGPLFCVSSILLLPLALGYPLLCPGQFG